MTTRPPLVLAGSSWPISDEVGVNGDFFMLVGTNNTFIVFGPKRNSTWVGVPQCTFANQLVPPVTYLQYIGDQAGQAITALPTNGTGVNGQICILTDINNNLCAIAINNNGVWSVLGAAFQLGLTILTSGGQPIYTQTSGNPGSPDSGNG